MFGPRDSGGSQIVQSKKDRQATNMHVQLSWSQAFSLSKNILRCLFIIVLDKEIQIPAGALLTVKKKGKKERKKERKEGRKEERKKEVLGQKMLRMSLYATLAQMKNLAFFRQSVLCLRLHKT